MEFIYLNPKPNPLRVYKISPCILQYFFRLPSYAIASNPLVYASSEVLVCIFTTEYYYVPDTAVINFKKIGLLPAIKILKSLKSILIP